MKPRTNSRGFTLLEIMIVLAIVGIMTAIAVPSFRGMTQRLRVKAAGREIAMDLALARVKAISLGVPQTVSFVAASTTCRDNSGAWTTTGGKMKCLAENYYGVSFQHTSGDPFQLKDNIGADNDDVIFKPSGGLSNDLSTWNEIGTIYLKGQNGTQVKITVRQYSGLAKLQDGW